MKQGLSKRNRGFTLLESMVAIGILSLSILATFTAVQGGLQGSNTAKDQVTAFYLAQDAMEYIKNVRDENAINSLSGNPRSWIYGLAAQASDACYFGKTCTIDSPMRAVATCSGGFDTCPVLKQESTSNLYGYTPSWTDSKYRREIQLSNISATEIRVTIRVSWTTRGQSKSFQISQLLFNRQ